VSLFKTKTSKIKPKKAPKISEITKSIKQKENYDDDFTQISSIAAPQPVKPRKTLPSPPPLPPTQPITTPVTSLPTHNQQTDEDEEKSTSTTSIDVSSLTENQPSVIQTPHENQRPKSRSKSLNQSLISMNTNKTATLNTILTTQDASDFYNLNKILAKPPNSGINNGSQLSLNSILTKEKDDLNLNKSKTSLNTSLENLATTKRNQSPIQRMKSPAKFESSISNKDSIQDLMKSELMKIFQIQHDTVMSFLNKGQSQPPQPLPKSNIEQQINSILSQQQQQQYQSNGDQIEFIIETKVKAIDSSSGKKTTTTTTSTKTVSPTKENNYFMKTFDSTTTNKDSKFIKIPLLSTRTNDTPRDHSLSSSPSRSHRPAQHLPLIEKNLNESNFKLLTFKNNNSKTTNNNLLHLQTTNQQVNKHVKNFIQQTNTNQSLKKLNNYHNFQLLKLNYSSKQITNENVIQPPIQPPPQVVLQPQIELPKEPVKVTHHSVTNKETQVDKPNYDGYILPANIFKENESLDYESNAQIHYKSTQHLRQPQQQAESNLKR